jgi:curved DNA-binding protein CbpA
MINNLQQAYKVLECDPKSDLRTIKQAYKRLILKYHPDHNKMSVKSNTKTILINKAFTIIKNHDKPPRLINTDYYSYSNVMQRKHEEELEYKRECIKEYDNFYMKNLDMLLYLRFIKKWNINTIKYYFQDYGSYPQNKFNYRLLDFFQNNGYGKTKNIKSKYKNILEDLDLEELSRYIIC